MKINTASRFVTGVAQLTRAALLLWLISFGIAQAQSTQFTYQGRLTDNSLPANGTYDFQFKLFDAPNGGAQVGTTVSLTNINVSSGIFTVTLDFGAGAFPGANRFLEINVRLAGGGAFTPLNPRQPVTSTPYAIQSLNAANATNFSGALAGDVTGTQGATALANNAVTTPKLADGNVTDAKIASVAGSKITGTIPVVGVPAGSTNYIQNGTAQQASSNFNISGNGTIGGTLTAGTFSGNGSSLTNLNAANIATGTLAIARGGTGITAAPTAVGQFLRSAGANTWAVGSLAASDLPSGSTNYIQNGTASQVGNFHITQVGRAGQDLNAGRGINVDDGGVYDGNFLSTFGGLRFGSTGTQSGEGIASKRTAGGNAFGLDFFTSYTARLSITNGGNVGIGTNTPGSLLTLNPSSATTTALEVKQGAIKVTGAGINTNTAAFIHEVTAGNIDPMLTDATVINNALTNGDPNAILIVTTVLRPGHGSPNKAVYLDYDTGTGRWRINNIDFSAMVVGQNFNVLVVKP
jgi:hypothetical protein